MNAAAKVIAERTARLVIEAMCSTCGALEDADQGLSIIDLIVAHTQATGHVVILNGTCDAPNEEVGGKSFARART